MVGLKIPVIPIVRGALKIRTLETKQYTLPHYLDEIENMTERAGLSIRDDIDGYVAEHREIILKGDALDPDNIDENYTYDDVERLANKLDEFMPDFGEFEIMDGYNAVSDIVPDGGHIVDRVEHPEGMIICAGGCGEGISTSAGIGLLASQLVIDGRILFVKNPSLWSYSRSRFPGI